MFLSKDAISQRQRQGTARGEIGSVDHVSDKELVSKICKELMKFNSKKADDTTEKRQEI